MNKHVWMRFFKWIKVNKLCFECEKVIDFGTIELGKQDDNYDIVVKKEP
jgi:hypothetical protein